MHCKDTILRTQNNWPYSKLIPNSGNVRLPAYHRLDLGMNIYRKLKRGRTGIWNISLYNAYSRMNPIMIEKDNQKQTTDGKRLYPRFRQFALFPIIPSVSYTYKF